MKSQILIASLALLAIAGMSFSTMAFTNPAFPTLTMRVNNPSGNPIQSANVYISFEDNVNVEYQLEQTNSNGRANFAIANNTMYQFVINGTGYSTVTGNFEFTWVNGGSTVNEYVSSNACKTNYTLKGDSFNTTVITIKSTVC